jgi:hypothetical protein
MTIWMLYDRPREETTPEPAEETPGRNVAPPGTVQESPAEAEPADSPDGVCVLRRGPLLARNGYRGREVFRSLRI